MVKDLSKYILKRRTEDTTLMYDSVYLPSYNEILSESSSLLARRANPTDYAIANGAANLHFQKTLAGKKGCTFYYLRNERNKPNLTMVDAINTEGQYKQVSPSLESIGICPAMLLNAKEIASAVAVDENSFKIGEVKRKNEGYHTIQFGEFPQTVVDRKLQNILMDELSKGNLQKTGKKYVSCNLFYNAYNWEFEYNGQKYVYFPHTKPYDRKTFYSDGSQPTKSYDWFKVEPVVWKIKNWNSLPKAINPEGTGSHEYIDVSAESVILSGIPFHLDEKVHNSALWQNSTIRGYLNGINVNNIQENGDPNFSANNGGDFSNENNFLTEAFNIELQKVKEKPVTEEKTIEKTKRTRKGYGVQVAETPMSISEQIKFYINSGTSFMLHGPSGVGKTRRIEEADPEFVSIVLRNGILPEEVIGKTIFPNNDKTTGGIWVPPAWYVSLCEKCKNQPDKNHVLFIDEITNVKPSEQSLVFHLVLNNSIGPNVGKLPENVVVVAAGNNKEESEAAYNMPEPLFRRFDGHIYLEADIKQWLEWGSEPSKKGKERLKIHPIVSAFVATYAEDVFYSSYDSEEPPKYALDPRGWEQISDIIYNNKGLISKELISNKVGEKIAANFIEFAKNPPLMLEEILEDNYDEEDIPHKFDAQYALAISLRNANFEQVAKVREFVANKLNGEILPMFDSVWVGENSERAIFMNELQQTQKEILEEEQEVEEIENIKNSKRITVDEFWQSKDLLGINCRELWQSKILMEVFNTMGKTWNSGFPYSKDYSKFECYGSDTVYTNKSDFGTTNLSTHGCRIYDFNEVDLSKYLDKHKTNNPIKSTKLTNTKYKKTLDDFCDTERVYGIRCFEEWQAKLVVRAFNRRSIVLGEDIKYDSKDVQFYNQGLYYKDGFIDRESGPVLDGIFMFNEVDITKYLNQKDCNYLNEKLNEELENC